MILHLMPGMSEEELQDRLAAMDRSFKKLMARPNGARLLLFELGLIDSPEPKKKAKRRRAKKAAAKKAKA